MASVGVLKAILGSFSNEYTKTPIRLKVTMSVAIRLFSSAKTA